MNPNDIFQIRNLLQNASGVLIALGQKADVDAAAAGLGLFLSLSKTGKKTNIVSPDKMLVELSYLFAVDKIENRLTGSNNLVVSLPYKEGVIERVSYNIAEGKFNLVIEPRNNKLNFDPKQIEYRFGSGSYDLIFTLAAPQLQALGNIYEESLFSKKPIINIDKNKDNESYGRVNLLVYASLSQTVALLLKGLRLPLDQDIASNLLTGLSSFNQDLSLINTKPETLEAAAFLLRAGGGVLGYAPSLPKREQPFKEEKEEEEKKTPDEWLKPKIFTTQKDTTIL